MGKEDWLWVKGYRNNYLVSTRGRLQSVSTGMLLKVSLNSCGYARVALTKNRKTSFKMLSRVVATAFIPNLEKKPEVNHKDGNKLNNAVSNLEWSTVSENRKHAWKIGLNKGNTHIFINGKHR